MRNEGSLKPGLTTSADPREPDARDALAKILTAPDFQASEQRRKFLSYIVEESLAGRADQLKGYTVALAVFDRDESFDAQADPIVRIEARRLRHDLNGYYAGTGRDDPVYITVPKGAYVPNFQWNVALNPHSQQDDASPPMAPGEIVEGSAVNQVAEQRHQVSWRVGLAIIGVFLLLAVASATFLRNRSEDVIVGPERTDGLALVNVVLLPFEAIDRSDQSRAISAGLDSETVLDLRLFSGLRVFQPQSEQTLTVALANLRKHVGAIYVVRGSVLSDDTRSDISIRLFDATTDEVIWSKSFKIDRADGAIMDLREKLAGSIAAALGHHYGPVGNDLRSRFEVAYPKNFQSHICVLHAYGYRRSFSREDYSPTLACLERAVVRDPGYADAWAMLGWLYLDDGIYDFTGSDQSALFAQANESVEHAMSIDPENVLVLKAASAVRHYLGDYDASTRLARRALELNPNDPDTLAQFGWRLAVREEFSEGIPAIEQAIALSMDPPGWYFFWISLHAYIDGDYPKALEAAKKTVGGQAIAGQALIAMSAAKLGQRQTVVEAFSKMPLDHPLNRDPFAESKKHGSTDAIARAFADGLQYARAFVERSADR